MKLLPSSLGKKIILWLLVIFGILWSIFFYWLDKQQNYILIAQLKHQALGIYHYIVLTRQWISSVGGLYIKTKDGDYEKITPSAFTKKIARFAAKKMPYRVKIAVNNAINPDHSPSKFEQKAINLFEAKKATSYCQLIKIKGHILFKYAAPLIFENECINCHAKKLYLNKEVLGCISISFPADSIYQTISETRRTFSFYLLTIFLFMLSLLYLMLRRFVIAPLNHLKDASDQIEQGNLDVKVELKASKEWEKVAHSFNRMISSLANQQRILKHEVEKAVKELSKAYDELKQVERYKSDFFSNVTHDLKTPITAIKGATELMYKKYGNNPDIKSYLEIQQRNIEKLSTMVGNLLDCAKIEAGKLELNLEEADISEVIEDAVLMVMPISWDKKVKLEYSPPEQPLIAMIDRNRIEQAISNLLSNAIRFSPKNKSVEVKLSSNKNFAQITVEDYGPGIPKEEWDKVFMKFFRRAGEKASEGIGLGLAIVKAIIEAHGGRVWISQPTHKGTAFNITIPLINKNKQEVFSESKKNTNS